MIDIEGKKFMLVIGIMLILSGATFLYFRSQVSTLEKAIGKQNQVLSSFIANVQNELRGAVPRGPVEDRAVGPMEGGTPSEPERCGVPNDRIEVSSDDDDSDNDNDSDDGSDSDSSNTSSEDEAGIKIGEDEPEPDIKVIEMLKETQEVIESQGKVIEIAEVSLNDMAMGFIDNDSDDIVADISEDADGDDDDGDDDDDDGDDGDDETDSDIDSIPVDNITVKKLTNIDIEEPIDYNTEKKAVLIQFCKEKGLGDESTLKRYKKQELVNLLSSV